jgi:ATP-dependent DNA helicase RecQ
VLLRGLEDEDIQNYFIERAFAADYIVNDVLKAFERFDGPVPALRVQNMVNVSWGTLELVLKQLDVDGALRRTSGQTYERTLQPWDYPTARVEQVTRSPSQQQAMIDYHDERMPDAVPANLLDDRHEIMRPCDNAAATRPSRTPCRADRGGGTIPPQATDRDRRKKMSSTWADSKIPANEQLEPDAPHLGRRGGAGSPRRQLRDSHFDDRLIEPLGSCRGMA